VFVAQLTGYASSSTMERPSHCPERLGASSVWLISCAAKFMPLQRKMLRVIGRPKGLTLERHKKAILIGINYDGGVEEMRLAFPIRDIKEVERLLKGELSFRAWKSMLLISIIFHTIRVVWV
jgi:hypothetical protein